MNWRRGSLRLWVVLTVLWLVGATGWMAHLGNEQHRQLARLNCEDLLLSDFDAYEECYNRWRGPSSGETWFMVNMREFGWLVWGVPPIVLLIFGGMALKTAGWVSKGFRDDT